MNAPYFNFVNLAGGNRLKGPKQAASQGAQDAAKREAVVPVSLPTIGGKTYWRLAGQLHRNGVALPAREH